MNQFEKQALDTHNKYRASHHASPLSWNSNLAREAQTWADRLAREDRLKHASTDDGENIYMSFGDIDVTGSVAVDKWYDEVKEYNFSRPGFQSNTGHFTQVVWRGSKEIGVGRAQGYDGKVFVVARYRPPGNNLRTFEENVLPGQKHYPMHSSDGWNLPEVNGDYTIDPVQNTSTAWKNPDRWDPIYTGDRYSPNRLRESSKNTHNRGRENYRDAPNWGRDANKDIPKRGREEKSYSYQEPRKNSWEPRQNGGRQYPTATTKYSGGVGKDVIFDHKWDSGKWFDEDVIEPTVNTAQHSSPERKILKDSTNVKDAKKSKEKGIAGRWQPQGNENRQKDDKIPFGRRGHYGGSVDRNKSANKVRLSMEKWETIGTNDDLDGREDVKVGKSRTRESIKRWEEQSFNQPHLPFQHQRPSQTKTGTPAPRPARSSQQPIRSAQASQVQAGAERWDPLWGDKPLSEHKARPVSWDSSRFVGDRVDSYQQRSRSFNEPKKITTTIGEGPRKTVVSSITIVLKGNEGHGTSNKPRSKSTEDLRRLDRPKSSYTRARRQPVQEVYAEQRASRTNTRPKSEDFTSRAFDDWEAKRPVVEDHIIPEVKKSDKPYDTTDSFHGNRNENIRAQFPSLDHFSQQALDCHNVYRALHDSSNLMWSPQIAAEAQAWAEHLARERTLKHSTRERGADGENLAMFSGNQESAAREATDMWYDEVKNYDFSRPGYQPRSGHFTQLVWKGSKEFGMGSAQTSDGQLTIVVARYRPPGNVIRNYELNVFPKHSFF